LSFEELAALLGCSLSSAHRRYSSALETLKGIVTHECHESPCDVSCTSKSTGQGRQVDRQVDRQVEPLNQPASRPVVQPD
jgi:hypothetical protein